LARNCFSLARAQFESSDFHRSDRRRLVAAYPGVLARVTTGSTLYWRDGNVMTVSDGITNKPFDQLLRNASMLDQLPLSASVGKTGRSAGTER
jgi:hypothetical protein